MQNKRREFLKKSLLASAISVAGISAVASSDKTGNSGVTSGKSRKKEVLYYKTPMWEKYYKIAY